MVKSIVPQLQETWTTLQWFHLEHWGQKDHFGDRSRMVFLGFPISADMLTYWPNVVNLLWKVIVLCFTFFVLSQCNSLLYVGVWFFWNVRWTIFVNLGLTFRYFWFCANSHLYTGLELLWSCLDFFILFFFLTNFLMIRLFPSIDVDEVYCIFGQLKSLSALKFLL